MNYDNILTHNKTTVIIINYYSFEMLTFQLIQSKTNQ